MINTSQPDARIVGGLFVYILPEHIWGKVAGQELTGSYQPRAAAGRQRARTSSPSSSAGGSCGWSATRTSAGEKPRLRRDPVHQVRHPGRGRARADAGRDRPRSSRSQAADLRAARRRAQHRDGQEPVAVVTRSWRSTSARRRTARTRSSTRRSRTATVRQAIAYAVDRDRINEISTPRHVVRRPTGSCRRSTRRSTRRPSRTTRPTSRRRTRSSTTPAGTTTATASAHEGRRRRSRSTCSCARSRRPTPRRRSWSPRWRSEIGVEFNVQVVSADKLTEITMRTGRRQAGPGLRHVHLGLGRRPVRPELPARACSRPSQIGGSSDSFYSNPEYDRLFKRAGRRVRRRRAQGARSGRWSTSPSATCPTSC